MIPNYAGNPASVPGPEKRGPEKTAPEKRGPQESNQRPRRSYHSSGRSTGRRNSRFTDPRIVRQKRVGYLLRGTRPSGASHKRDPTLIYRSLPRGGSDGGTRSILSRSRTTRCWKSCITSTCAILYWTNLNSTKPLVD